jgi:hypothetical protein
MYLPGIVERFVEMPRHLMAVLDLLNASFAVVENKMSCERWPDV